MDPLPTPTTASSRAHQRFSSDDISITSSTTYEFSDANELLDTGSFIYNPSFASSKTSIASNKTERAINSGKSRYNTPPRHTYAERSNLPQVLRRKMLTALQFSRYVEPSGARMATPTLALSLIPSYSWSLETLQPDVMTDYLEKQGNLSELRRVEVIGMHLYSNF